MSELELFNPRRHARLIFELAADVYAWLTWLPEWRAHCASLVDYFPALERPLDVLDVGVGPGVSAIAIADRLPDARVVGLDFSQRMLTTAQGYLERYSAARQIHLLRADAATLPLPDASFDVVTGHSFLYLLPQREQVVDEIARVLRPGGHCVFLEPGDGGDMLSWLKVPGSPKLKLCMGLWRVFSGRAGRFSETTLAQLLGRRLEHVEVSRTLEGLGLLGRARRKDHT
ncbi:MAG: class I SAM-dependent methyltransferase [Myxococcales bacterium]|nr:class I SAM-dependent methyltransferase [Myxococcales bacterium]